MFRFVIVLLTSINVITSGSGVTLVQEIDFVSLSSGMSFTPNIKSITQTLYKLYGGARGAVKGQCLAQGYLCGTLVVGGFKPPTFR